MAGWQAYVKNLIDSSSCIRKAAIVGVSDGSMWACSEMVERFKSLQATSEEIKKFVSLFNNINDVPTTGFVLEGKKYIVPRVEENLIFGKKDKTGVFAVKTKMAVIIACFEGDSQEGLVCRDSVERIGNYLEQQGY
ncbi:Profilin family protein [Trichuris trichiura]|uniref:Profilin n=1 Tax=Trichuris trichiura TaxID=36087 RepID=A0A077YX52_TRITR|nr:Profilin family protein [Trichuris trichiura]